MAVLAACVPTFPAGATLTATPEGAFVRLSWPAASHDDDKAVASYRVDVDGAEVSRVTGTATTCLLKGLANGSTHQVTITAYDTAGQWSGSSGSNASVTGSVTAPASGDPGPEVVCDGPLTIATGSLPSGFVGLGYLAQLESTGGSGAVSWSATGLPDGLVVDAGAISGSPTEVFDAQVTVTATDGATSVSVPLHLVVAEGVPQECLGVDCVELTPEAGTVEVPGSVVVSVTRVGADPTGMVLASGAPAVTTGQIVVVSTGDQTPSGLVVKATSVAPGAGGTTVLGVQRSSLDQAYENGLIRTVSTTETVAEPGDPGAGAGPSCSGDANVEITPTVTPSFKPNLTLLWGRNYAGFGNVFIGRNGIHRFQFDMFGSLEFKLRGTINGSVTCSLPGPTFRSTIPLGSAGAAIFKLQPSLTLNADAAVTIDTTVTIRCGLVYAYQPDGEFRSQYCTPAYTTPSVNADETGAKLTIAGALDASITWNDLAGLTGNLTASVTAEYRPLPTPKGTLKGKITASLGACIACFMGNNAPSVTIASTDILKERTIATWDPTTPAPGPTTPSLIAAGENHICTITAGGTVKCWGSNNSGQLGDGTTTNSSTPVTVTGISGATSIAASGFLFYHSCALGTGDAVKCWGNNGYGQLGDGTTTNASTPVTVQGLTGATAIAVGTNHSCALLTAGTVKCWGGNMFGELGDGSSGATNSPPVTVQGLTGATAIAAGPGHSCALLNAGTVKCWGYNASGQLGNGTTTNSPVPVTVQGLTGATAISAGVFNSCALAAGGTVKCWGNNSYGQLGDGTTTNASTPVIVQGLTGAAAIAVGTSHSCALLTAGTIECWGSNASGQLGNGTTTNSPVPVTVQSLTGATAISAGGQHSCALLTAVTVKCWGSNGFGQLGDGTTNSHPTPVLVIGL